MTKRRLNEKQIAAIEYLSVPKRGGLTYGEIADKVGVSDRTLNRWRNDDHFNDELNRRIVRGLSDRLPEIVDSVPDHIINDGNAAMFRTVMQALGQLTEKVEVNTNEESTDIGEMKAKIEQYRRKQSDTGE